jgi:hypothetical protein
MVFLYLLGSRRVGSKFLGLYTQGSNEHTTTIPIGAGFSRNQSSVIGLDKDLGLFPRSAEGKNL